MIFLDIQVEHCSGKVIKHQHFAEDGTLRNGTHTSPPLYPPNPPPLLPSPNPPPLLSSPLPLNPLSSPFS
jgi:hypothetical protein